MRDTHVWHLIVNCSKCWRKTQGSIHIWMILKNSERELDSIRRRNSVMFIVYAMQCLYSASVIYSNLVVFCWQLSSFDGINFAGEELKPETSERIIRSENGLRNNFHWSMCGEKYMFVFRCYFASYTNLIKFPLTYRIVRPFVIHIKFSYASMKYQKHLCMVNRRMKAMRTYCHAINIVFSNFMWFRRRFHSQNKNRSEEAKTIIPYDKMQQLPNGGTYIISYNSIKCLLWILF